MAYQASYRKWRPNTFDDVVGQEHITDTLKNEIMHQKVAHAYLFTGVRGTGKTSTAKIFSRAINCPNPKDGNPCNECELCKGILDGSILDVTEIDAASNNGVDNIRDIRDEVVYTASRTQYKVYIIDEVHMLSTGAFNALLKTLEEPPAHVVFILATTDVHKVPETILSRCQRFDFKRIAAKDVETRLREVLQSDGVALDNQALSLVASLAEGSLRDALSILDRCLAYGQKEITYDDVTAILGVAQSALVTEITRAMARGDSGAAIIALDGAIAQGKDMTQLLDGMLRHFRNLLMVSMVKNPESVLEGGQETLADLSKMAGLFTGEKLLNCVKVLSETAGTLKFAGFPRVHIELAFIKLCMPQYDLTPEALMDRLSMLEKRLQEGVPVVAVVPEKVAQAATNNAPKEPVQQQVEPPTEIPEKTDDITEIVSNEIQQVAQERPAPQNIAEIVSNGTDFWQDKWQTLIDHIAKKRPAMGGSLRLTTAAGNEKELTVFVKKGSEGILHFLSGEDNKKLILDTVGQLFHVIPIKLRFDIAADKPKNAPVTGQFDHLPPGLVTVVEE